MQEGGIKSGANVLIIDDLIATGTSRFRRHSLLRFTVQVLRSEKTNSQFFNANPIGGSASAAGELVEKCGAKVIENLFVIEIELYVVYFLPSLCSSFPCICKD